MTEDRNDTKGHPPCGESVVLVLALLLVLIIGTCVGVTSWIG